MTHRKNIVAIDATETLENAFQFMLGESYSRFPIYEEDIDRDHRFYPSAGGGDLLSG